MSSTAPRRVFVIWLGGPLPAIRAVGYREVSRHGAATFGVERLRPPRDRAGFPIDGRPSDYPVTWTALLADIFHPLALRHRHHILNTLPPPSFERYQ